MPAALPPPSPGTLRFMALLPPNARSLIEVGGGADGALARHYKHVYAGCFYQGVERDAQQAALARGHCDVVHQADIEQAGAAFFAHFAMADCWIFDQTIARLRQPWAVLHAIRRHIAPDACLVLRVPNGQHWAQQTRLNGGAFYYQEGGPLPRAQLRHFTRSTMLELLRETGFRMSAGTPLNGEPAPPAVAEALRALARRAGVDADQALQDALATHYLLKAVPA
ncbi:MAG: methyltransferase domain-containing protein [Pseudomonadota bacterium]